MDWTVEQARADLSARLRARLPEIADATLARVYGVADPGLAQRLPGARAELAGLTNRDSLASLAAVLAASITLRLP